MNLALRSIAELETVAAQWILCHSRTAPLPGTEDADEFIETYRLPETPFEYTQSFVGDDGEITVLFKTTILLHSWQTCSGKQDMAFCYYKVCRAMTDANGTVCEYALLGYILVE